MFSPSPEHPYPRPAYSWYVVGVLTCVYIFSFIDRQILNLLVGPIRRDLHISDTEMSLLMGFTFAVFYTFFGIPLGRWADSGNRRGIIAAGFVVWSLFTAGCGVAKTFAQMALMRVGVGIGEASLSPAAYSMIADYFPPQRRATALSAYSMGIYIGSGLAMLLGGIVIRFASGRDLWSLPLVGSVRPRQLIFFAVGLPGLLFALVLFSVREPVRRGLKKSGAVGGREVLAYIKANRKTFLCHNLGISFVAAVSYGSSAWVPTFMQRVHHWSAAEAGIRYGTVVMIFGTLGVYCGGRFADYLRAKGRADANLRVMWLAAVCWLPFAVGNPFIPDRDLYLVALVPAVFLAAAPFGVAPAAITQIMPNPMRGTAAASYLFVNNLIGLGFGPTAVALFTDYVFGRDNAVGYSLASVAAVSLILASLILYAGLKPFARSLEYLATWNASHT